MEITKKQVNLIPVKKAPPSLLTADPVLTNSKCEIPLLSYFN